jgi:hypothetical protein
MHNPIPMFLLEVYNVTDPSNRYLFKRRISGSILSIEDWIDSNAQKWAFYAVDVTHDGNGNGAVYIRGDKNPIFEFTTTNIAII